MRVSVMTEVRLDGYRPDKRGWPSYLLCPHTGRVITRWFENQEKSFALGGLCGTGDFRRYGSLFRRVSGFFALYVANEVLYLWLDGRCINLFKESVIIERKVDFLLRKKFTVYLGGAKVFECRYSYLDYEDFPDKDILWYLARSLDTKESMMRSFLIWRDQCSGNFDPTI